MSFPHFLQRLPQLPSMAALFIFLSCTPATEHSQGKEDDLPARTPVLPEAPSEPTPSPSPYPITLLPSKAQWTGVVSKEDLPGYRVDPIRDTEAWSSFWSTVGKPLPAPEVDFRSQFLWVEVRDLDDPNSWSSKLSISESGKIQKSITQTLIGRDGPPSRFSRYWIYQLPRHGIRQF